MATTTKSRERRADSGVSVTGTGTATEAGLERSKGVERGGSGAGSGSGSAPARGVSGSGLGLGLGGWLLVGFSGGMAQGVAEFGYFEGRRLAGMSSLDLASDTLWWMPLGQGFLTAFLAVPFLVLGVWRGRARGPEAGRAWAGGGLAGLWAFATLLWFTRLHALASLALAAGAGRRVGPWLGARGASARRWALAALPFLGLANAGIGWLGDSRARCDAAGIGGLAAGAWAGEARGGAPNVLWIVLDTARGDVMETAETPTLRSIASRGVEFGRAIAPSSWTLPSHASMFTGRPAEQLGVGPEDPLPEGPPTLAEVLRDRGYATAGFSANPMYCTRRAGLGRGFALFDDRPAEASAAKRAARVTRLGEFLWTRFGAPGLTRAALAAGLSASDVYWGLHREKLTSERLNARVFGNRGAREALASGVPMFLFLNYIDPHHPYIPPRGRRMETRAESFEDFFALHETSLVSDEDLEAREGLLRRAYRECVEALDEELGRLLEGLGRTGFLDDCVLVVTSDHGESFGEHGIFTHGRSLHQTEIRVPLLISAPGRAPEGVFVGDAVSTTDIAATILDLIGWEGDFPGRSLRGAWESASGAGNGTVPYSSLGEYRPLPDIAGAKRMEMPARAIVREGHSLIQEGDRTRYHDLESDPGETRDLAAAPDAETARAIEEARGELNRIRESNEAARRALGIEGEDEGDRD